MNDIRPTSKVFINPHMRRSSWERRIVGLLTPVGARLRRIASAAQFDTAKPILANLDPSSGSAKLDELTEAFSNMLDERGVDPRVSRQGEHWVSEQFGT
jgi:hypothetical protein